MYFTKVERAYDPTYVQVCILPRWRERMTHIHAGVGDWLKLEGGGGGGGGGGSVYSLDCYWYFLFPMLQQKAK